MTTSGALGNSRTRPRPIRPPHDREAATFGYICQAQLSEGPLGGSYGQQWGRKTPPMVPGAEPGRLAHHGCRGRMAGVCPSYVSTVLVVSSPVAQRISMKAFRNIAQWMGNKRRATEPSSASGPTPKETLDQLLREGDRAVLRSEATSPPFLNTSPLTHLVEGELKSSD